MGPVYLLTAPPAMAVELCQVSSTSTFTAQLDAASPTSLVAKPHDDDDDEFVSLVGA